MISFYWLLLALPACCRMVAAAEESTIGKLNLTASCPNVYCSIAGQSRTPAGPVTVVNSSVPHLKELVFRNYIMRSIPVQAMRMAPNLSAFLMQNCAIYRVNPEDFNHARQLKQLVLQRNHISHLTEKLFELLPELELLELGYNIIHTVHKQAFVGLASLQVLGLQGNGIRTLMDGAFAPLKELQHLDLSGNELEKLNSTAFAQNTKLETLLLSGNRFVEFKPYALTSVPHLRLLDVSNCNTLPELHVQSVDTLLAEGSGLQRLVIAGSVIKLHAGNNELTQLSISDKRSVLELDLHTNLLKEVGKLLDGMLNLQRLDLSKNSIDELRAPNGSQFLILPSLEYLNLASNQLRSITPENFLLLGGLQHLDLSFNHLLPLTVHNLEPLINLQRLYIEGNRLHEFDYELFHRQHAHLKELGLCDNEWEFAFMRKMVTYLSDRGVHLPARFVRRQEDANGTLTPKFVHQLFAEDHQLEAGTSRTKFPAGVASIHPYWTKRDILAFATLIVVFAILLLQLIRILQEEGCWTRCQMRSWLGRTRRRPAAQSNGSQQGGPRPRRLNEEDSELSSSE
ncbi:leucine-rich repeat-containing protein let-4-like [Scaptodrosophila lebanonensis]|uniref:Leucine-rich repeat-containing protein let-4-like n=1 Tax=Drosophila lebanonensis TaxID=7225 RepID=A0A6J2T4Y8_DROLE|nr:leucine-rich repeat-containing protein let-4-like [Scaptodrosophila lebanonensis]